MSWVSKKIQNLQNRPYQERIRFLKIALITVAVIMVIFWILTLRFRNYQGQNTTSGFTEIWDNLKKLKDLSPQKGN